MDRDEAIKTIRANLRKRSGKAWSVTGGRGTGWGWIHISAPPKRRVNGCMTPEDGMELAHLLDLHRAVHQYESVPASSDYYREYVDRSAGVAPTIYGQRYWD